MSTQSLTGPIRSWCDSHREELVALLGELVALDSPTGNAELIRTFVHRYRALLESAGLVCQEIEGAGGPNLLAERAADGEETGAPIVVVGHSDTVWPAGEAERRPPRIEGGRMYGPGVLDMRGGLCLIVAAVRCLGELRIELPRRVQVFVAADEESGGETAHDAMRRLLSPQSVALVPEPPLPGGDLKGERKGVGIFTVELRGVEAHAGVEPERGASAVHELVRVILALEAVADHERGVTVNVGEVHGGTASNVVAGHAVAEVDLRFEHQADGERASERILALSSSNPRVEIEVRGGLIFPPLAATPRNRRLWEIAIRVGRELGLELGIGKSGGGSDGSFLSAEGLGVLDGLGPDGSGPHALDEHVELETFAERAAYFTRLLVELAICGEA